MLRSKNFDFFFFFFVTFVDDDDVRRFVSFFFSLIDTDDFSLDGYFSAQIACFGGVDFFNEEEYKKSPPSTNAKNVMSSNIFVFCCCF